MNKTRFGIILLIVEILQTTLFARLHIFGANLNLSLAFIMALSVLYGPIWGGYTGLGLGLLEDIIFAPILGVRALIYFLAGSILGKLFHRRELKPLASIFIVSCTTILAWALGLLIDFLIHVPVNRLYYLKGPLFIECLYNSIFYLICFAIIKKLLPPERVRTFSSLF